MFHMSFQNIERQKHYRNFWGDRLELWPSIYTHTHEQDIGKLVDSIMSSPVPKKLKGRFTVTEV